MVVWMGRGRAVTVHGARATSPMAGTSAMRPLEGMGRPRTVGIQATGGVPLPPGIDPPGSAAMSETASGMPPASNG